MSVSADDWFDAAPESQSILLNRLRKLIFSIAPDAVEQIKWNRPWYTTTLGPLCYLHYSKHHTTLGFAHGMSLDDPEQLLQGTGKAMRHVKLKTIADVERPAVAQLLTIAASRRP